MNRLKDLQSSGLALMLLSTFFFGFKPILVRMALDEGVTPEDILILRLMIAVPLFFLTVLLMRKLGDMWMPPVEFILSSIVAVAGMGGAMLFSFYAIKYLGASVSTLVIFVFPAITALLSFVFFGEPVTSRKKLSLLISFLGIILVVIPLSNGNGFGNIAGFDPGKGLFFAMLCALCWASTQVAYQKILEKRSPVTTALMTSVAMLVFFFAMNGMPSTGLTTRAWTAVILLGTVSWYVPFFLAMYALKMIGASKAAIVQSTGPGLTVLIAGLMLGEKLVALQFGGMFLLIYAVYMIGSEKSPARADQEPSTVAIRNGGTIEPEPLPVRDE
ncbi:MAG: DMT family transporter [Nitrospinota bacterium]|nr:DMT family transporter [Nitrospinota bacterium]